MLHVVCICPPVPGHLNPTITLGTELASRGHRVTFIGIRDAEPAVSAANLEFQPIGEAEFPVGSVAERSAQLGKMRGRQALRFTLDQLAEGEQVVFRDLPDVLRRIRVDGMIIDQFSAGASTVAEYLDLPFVTLCNALMTNREPAIPPFSVSWPYRDSWWARARNQAGWALFDRLMRPTSDARNE